MPKNIGEPAVRGTVTSLSSMFPIAEAQKAAKRVEEALEEKQKEMNRLKEFISDNRSLINLVQKLPDELHHDIMVPFGKAAFFPGRLIHTNEFMVLLGEGYYAERTAKQTVEILQRRGKALESGVNSLKANMEDLKVEASFFDTTALEAAEGLVEIREEYIEDNSSESLSDAGLKQDSTSVTEAQNTASGNEEYNHHISRLDELEKEEIPAAKNDIDKSEGSCGEIDDQNTATAEENWAQIMSRLDELEKQELAAQSNEGKDEDKLSDAPIGESVGDEAIGGNFNQESDEDHDSSHQNFTHLKDYQSLKTLQQTKDKPSSPKELSTNYHHQDFTSNLKRTEQTAEPVPRGEILQSRNMPKIETLNLSENPSHSLAEKKVKFEVEDSSVKKASFHTPKQRFNTSKAFTGSVVEHAQNLPTKQTSAASQSLDSQPSKPISRFKMQRK